MYTSSPTRTPGMVARTTRPVTSVTLPVRRRGLTSSSARRASPMSTSLGSGSDTPALLALERFLEGSELGLELGPDPGVDLTGRRLDDAPVAPDRFVSHEAHHDSGGRARQPAGARGLDGGQILGMNPQHH